MNKHIKCVNIVRKAREFNAEYVSVSLFKIYLYCLGSYDFYHIDFTLVRGARARRPPPLSFVQSWKVLDLKAKTLDMCCVTQYCNIHCITSAKCILFLTTTHGQTQHYNAAHEGPFPFHSSTIHHITCNTFHCMTWVLFALHVFISSHFVSCHSMSSFIPFHFMFIHSFTHSCYFSFIHSLTFFSGACIHWCCFDSPTHSSYVVLEFHCRACCGFGFKEETQHKVGRQTYHTMDGAGFEPTTSPSRQMIHSSPTSIPC